MKILMGQTLIALFLIATLGTVAQAQSTPVQGQHLTRKHRTRYVTGKPLLTIPKVKSAHIITFTPEDMRELVIQNRDVERVSFHQADLGE